LLGVSDREYVVFRLNEAIHHLDRALYFLERSETASLLDIIAPFSIPFDLVEYSAFGQAMLELRAAQQVLLEVYPYLRGRGVRLGIHDDTLLWMLVDVGLDNPIVDVLRHLRIRDIKAKVRRLRESVAELVAELGRP